MELKSFKCEKATNNSSNLSIKSSKSKKSEQLSYKPLGISVQNQTLINNLMRKYSYDPKIYIKNFIPVLRPKENDTNLIPSKLILNYKKRNSSTISHLSSFSEDESDDIENEELKLNLSNCFVNSVISDSSSESENEDKNEIKNTRKNFTKIRKNSLFRNLSKKNIKKKRAGKISLDIDEKSDFNLYEKISVSNEKVKNYNINKNSCIIFSSLNNNSKDLNDIKQQRNRINSFSILETLQNKLKLDI